MPPTFDRVLFDRAALGYFGRLPRAVQDCLKAAFRDLKTGRLELESPTPWRIWDGPSFVKACQHLVYASGNPERSTLVILELRPDTDEDAELL